MAASKRVRVISLVGGTRYSTHSRAAALAKAGHQLLQVERHFVRLAQRPLIVAAGTGTTAIAQSIDCNVPLVSRPAYILRTTPQGRLLNHILATPDGEIRQEPSGQILMPVAVSHQSDTAEELVQTPTDAADAAIARLRDICGGLENCDWSEVIRAERPVPKDGLPIVGPIAEGAYVAVLHSGITLGPIIAELIGKDITGRLDNADASMLAPYRPDRFIGR